MDVHPPQNAAIDYGPWPCDVWTLAQGHICEGTRRESRLQAYRQMAPRATLDSICLSQPAHDMRTDADRLLGASPEAPQFYP